MRSLHVLTSAVALCVVVSACSGSSSSTPSTNPTSAPTSTPVVPGTLSVNPTSVALNNAGAALAIVVQEPNYTGVFSETDTCNPSSGQIATIVTTNPAGAKTTYVATAFNAGECNVTFSDSSNQKVTIPVTVTTNSFGIQ